MRISDWSSDVCSSDLRTCRRDDHAHRAVPDRRAIEQSQRIDDRARRPIIVRRHRRAHDRIVGKQRMAPEGERYLREQFAVEAVAPEIEIDPHRRADRKIDVTGKRVYVRVDYGGRRISTNNKTK